MSETSEDIAVTEHVAVTHYLCSVMAEGEPADPRNFAGAMARSLGDLGVVPVMSTAYMSRYGVDPIKAGLKDQWLTVCGSARAREDFVMAWPDLARSLDFICGVTSAQVEKLSDDTNGGSNG